MEKFINLIKDYNLRKKCLCFELREKMEHFTFRKRFRIFNVNSFAKDKRSLPGMYTPVPGICTYCTFTHHSVLRAALHAKAG